MALKIPDELKAQAPPTMWGRILTTSPVVMAVLATMLAGLSSSEMTRAQYDRSLAAQQQSKAGDQWSFFQAKRMRSATQRNTLDLLQATLDIGPLSLAALRQSAEQLPTNVAALSSQVGNVLNHAPGGEANAAADAYLKGAEQRAGAAATLKTEMLAALDSADAVPALAAMQRGEVTEPPAAATLDANLKAALAAIESSMSEAEIAPLVARTDDKALTEALRAAKDRTAALDEATQPVNQTIDRLSKLIDRQAALLQDGRAVLLAAGIAPKAPPSVNSAFTAGRLTYTAARYDAEARLNQNIANLYELQVRRSNQSAERHHARSQRFFYGMLGAQLAVIISTFAIAAQKRNLLWSLAAGAGLLAAVFGAYVYLCV